MSFETTATIANFGGKLLKLAHQVRSLMEIWKRHPARETH